MLYNFIFMLRPKRSVKERCIKGNGHRQETVERINFSPPQLELTADQEQTGLDNHRI